MQSRLALPAAPGQLRCEWLDDPLGVGTPAPAFSWQSQDARDAEIESAWQVLVASRREDLTSAAGASVTADLWDSGVVPGSSRGQVVRYAGVPLISRQVAWWTVRCFDSDGISSGFAEPARLELGLLSRDDWRAQWLGAAQQGSATDGAAASVLLKEFVLEALPSRARLYLSVLGSARVELNGRPVGPWSGLTEAIDSRQRVRSYALDVTQHLLPGPNRLGMLLGDGWYAGNSERVGEREAFGRSPQLCAQLEWRTPGGEIGVLLSEPGWQTFESPILCADPLLGEAIDCRDWNPNWCCPGVDIAWHPRATRPAASPQGALVPYPLPRDVEPPALVSLPQQTHEWVLAEARSPGRSTTGSRVEGLVLDLGKPCRGRLNVRATVPGGGRLNIQYARERTALGKSRDADRFTGSTGIEQFEGELSLRAFRYALVTGDVDWEEPVVVTHRDVAASPTPRPAIDLDCQGHLWADLVEPALQSLHAAWGQRVLAPPPQDSAWAPWVVYPDRLCGCETAIALLAEGAAVSDVFELARDALRQDGRLPEQLPSRSREARVPSDRYREGRSDWFVDLVWILYSGFGDQRALELGLGEIDMLAARWQAQSRQGHWCDPSWSPSAELPPEYVGNARLCRALALAAELADSADDLRRAGRYRRFGAELRESFRRRFLTREGRLTERDASAALLALAGQLLTPEEQGAAVDDLRALLIRGALPLPELWPTLMTELHERGAGDLAFEVLDQILREQATVEEGVLGNDGPNAGWAGPTVAALLAGLLGVSLARPSAGQRPAWRDVQFTPRVYGFGATATQPVSVRCSLRTPSGVWQFGWQDEGQGSVLVDTQVAADMVLTLQLPDGSRVVQVAGQHRVQCATAGDGIPVLRSPLGAPPDPQVDSLVNPRVGSLLGPGRGRAQ
ncbi:MAG: alpha-L-rhamnosidase N-terminal domain-containing protein [Pseudomonadota bacterium]